MNRAALYARVSTAEQTEGHSIDAQIDSLRAYAAAHGSAVVDQFIDAGFSGDLADRPALTALLDAARRGLFDLVLIYRFDRLARDVRLFLNTEHELRQAGVRIVSATEVVDDTHEGRLQLLIKSSFAQYEKAVIRQRSELGSTRAAKEGKWMGGMPPYGYDLDPETSKLVVNDAEARVVRDIFRWFVDEQLTLDRVQQRLNALGIPTKWAVRVKKPSATTSNFWHRRTISRILNRDLYMGMFHFRKHRQPRGVPDTLATRRPEHEWIPVPVPPIIDLRTFELAQRQLRQNVILARRSMRRSYPLRSLIHCGLCGRRWVGKPHHSSDRYYLCPGRTKSATDIPCAATSVNGPLLESLVWDKVRELLLDPQTVLTRIQGRLRESSGSAAKEEHLKTLETEHDALRREHSRLLDVYRVGQLTLDEFVKERTDVKMKIARLGDERERLAAELGALAATETQIHTLEALSKNVRDVIPTLTDEHRFQLLRQIVERIVITGTGVEIHTIISSRDLPHSPELPTLHDTARTEGHAASATQQDTSPAERHAAADVPLPVSAAASASGLPIPLFAQLPPQYAEHRPRRSNQRSAPLGNSPHLT